MMANMVFLHLALGGAVHSGLKLFRYTTDTWYDWGTANDTLTNFWELNAQISNYWMFATHTVLFITQALSMAGIAGEVNLMAWMYFNMASMVVAMLMAYMYYKDWMHAQVMALPEEVQGKYKQGHGKEEHHDDGMEKKQGHGKEEHHDD